jgi:large-conductance mechanosensitive channel
LRRVVWYNFTDVLEVLAASIIRGLINLMMEAVSISETSVSTRLHGATTQKTGIFILAAVRTLNLTSY